MSNNPDKIKALEQVGVRVAERIPSIVDPIGSTENYLRTKARKNGSSVGLGRIGTVHSIPALRAGSSMAGPGD